MAADSLKATYRGVPRVARSQDQNLDSENKRCPRYEERSSH